MPEYFVIDSRGYPALDHDSEPRSFGSWTKAVACARSMARSEPGEAVVVAEAKAYVTCEVGAPRIELKERVLKGRRNAAKERKATAR